MKVLFALDTKYTVKEKDGEFEVWRGSSWVASYSTKEKAQKEADYRNSLGEPGPEFPWYHGK